MLNKLKPTEYLVVAGGAIVLIFGLLRWFSWEVDNDGVRGSGKSNAFDYLLTGVVPWLLLVGAGAVTVLLATGALNPGRVPWPLVILAATALGAVLIVIRLIIGDDPDLEGLDVDVSRGIGIWLSAIGAILGTVGAFLTYQANAFDSRTSGPLGNPQPDRELPPTNP
jgi:hypothetical protein